MTTQHQCLNSAALAWLKAAKSYKELGPYRPALEVGIEEFWRRYADCPPDGPHLSIAPWVVAAIFETIDGLREEVRRGNVRARSAERKYAELADRSRRALADAGKRLRGAGMLGGNDDPVVAALDPNTAAVEEPLPVSHQMITPECRRNRTAQGAWDEAVARLSSRYDTYVGDKANAHVTWHLKLERGE